MEAAPARDSWALRDERCVWHPFTQAQIAPSPICIVRGNGAYLYTEDGRAYLDAVASWWTNLHGHCHPYIANRIAAQAQLLDQVMFAGYTHPQAVSLAERLLELLPAGYSRVFFSDNGSTAVEVALKMALQVIGDGKRLLSFAGAYHGDTFGAMAAAGRTRYNQPFWPYLFEVHSVPPPVFGKEEESWKAFEQALNTGAIGAFIFEPLIQGANGMVPHCGEVLSRMINACRSHGIITIADEVMTGFGRTGPLFASSQLPAPDLICLSKGITGGFFPLGVTVTTEAIFRHYLSSDPEKAFLHGHSYTANPIICAAANASLDLLLKSHCHHARAMIENYHRNFKEDWGGHPKLLRCDVVGTILAIEYTIAPGFNGHLMKQRLIDHFLREQIVVRPIQNVVYILPPYCITQGDLERIYSVIISTLEDPSW